MSVYGTYGKRALDLVCGIFLLAVFWWLYVILAILVYKKLGSPILFTQKRPGKDEKIFRLYKFRSMTSQRDVHGELLPDEQRLTSFGKLLRSTSLDEIPEIFNVIKGDMSLVGPRPLLPVYLPYYTETERLRHSVRPGLTGLAQINGRNYLKWDNRLALDVQYVKTLSLLGDIKILWKTVLKVIKRSDIAETRIVPLNQERKERQHIKESF